MEKIEISIAGIAQQISKRPRSEADKRSALEIWYAYQSSSPIDTLNPDAQKLHQVIVSFVQGDTSSFHPEGLNDDAYRTYRYIQNLTRNWITKCFKDTTQWTTCTSKQGLEELITQLVNEKISFEDILFVTGLGLDRTSVVPLRLPAILTPALDAMKKIKQHTGVSPRYLVYQLTEFIADTNSIDKEAAHKSGEIMAKYLRRFVNKLYPEIANSVILKFNTPVDKQELQEIEEMLRRMEKDREFKSKMRQLQKCERKHSNDPDQKLYLR